MYFQESHRGHNEAGHAERALEALCVDDALLDRVQRAVGTRQPFDRHDFPAAHRVCEQRARIMRHIVDEDGAGAAFGTVAPQLGAGEAQLVAQRPRQRLLLHDVNAPLLAVDIDGDEPLARTDSRGLAQHRGGAEEIACRGDGHAARDDSFDKRASRDRLWRVLDHVHICCVCHAVVTSCRMQPDQVMG